MNKSVIEITHDHGVNMRKLAFEHALEMATIFRDFSDDPIGDLIDYLEKKIEGEDDDV